ncbi:MAG: hypothetical protein J0I42_16110 [Bosea sp.]|uniref:hypothetical protein n=1 Tax=Bosea sp. (in: a-proteobacteria) TaxID=1871050 RepID=UPI001AD4CE7C|nr:hypothetical protein [Bosea sp. (in: a-proteobacteria)]MBN9453471.1 hypothetical protein [Bosea sp. (in: a-proteobacteria)]
MVDHQAPAYSHGGGTVSHDGKSFAKIPGGARGDTYVGPSSPPRQIRDCEWIVIVHGVSGRAFAVICSAVPQHCVRDGHPRRCCRLSALPSRRRRNHGA